MSDFSQEAVDDAVYLFKRISNTSDSFNTSQGLTCFLLRKKIDYNYWIILNQSDEDMNPVIISLEAENIFGKKVCAERIHDLYQEYLRDLAKIERSPFFKG